MKPKKLWKCARLGAQWLVDRQAKDGSWKGLERPVLDAYYKASWALGLLGHARAAQRTLNYTATHLMQENGDLGPREHPWHNYVHYPYANAYIIIGGVRMGCYDIVSPALEFLLGLQCASSGGFCSLIAEGDTPLRCDTMSTAAAGLACLATGRLQPACWAADWLGEMIERQPDPEKRFYCTVDAENTLVTQFSQQDAAWRMVQTEQPDQIWYAVGLPLAFLVKLAQATGKRRHLDLAYWYLHFLERCINPWCGPSSGKAGWACSELYRMTGDETLRERALAIGAYMVGFQQEDGSFSLDPVPGTPSTAPSLSPGDLDLCAEYTLWLGLIATNLRSRAG